MESFGTNGWWPHKEIVATFEDAMEPFIIIVFIAIPPHALVIVVCRWCSKGRRL